MLNKIEANEAPLINGDGSQVYDFIYVEDVARSNIQALISEKDYGMYNVGTEVQTTINQLCDLIFGIKKSSLQVNYNPYSEGDARAMVKNRIGSRKKAEHELGFKFKYSLKHLQKVIEWRMASGIDKKKSKLKSKEQIAIIGAGIVGLAIAYKLTYKTKRVIVFEKEPEEGLHQSGRNSGVLHCGLYYQPGSLKAKLSVNGIREMIDFAKENNYYS